MDVTVGSEMCVGSGQVEHTVVKRAHLWSRWGCHYLLHLPLRTTHSLSQQAGPRQLLLRLLPLAQAHRLPAQLGVS